MQLNLHTLARTTPRMRAQLQAEDPRLSHNALAKRYGISAPTVRKWRERDLGRRSFTSSTYLSLHHDSCSRNGSHGASSYIVATAG